MKTKGEIKPGPDHLGEPRGYRRGPLEVTTRTVVVRVGVLVQREIDGRWHAKVRTDHKIHTGETRSQAIQAALDGYSGVRTGGHEKIKPRIKQ